MTFIKKIIGALCMLLAPVSAYMLTSKGFEKMAQASAADKTNAITQWSILIIIFLPVMAGLLIFGWYAVKGEFDEVV